MFIPEGETNARSHHISKRTFLLIVAGILLSAVLGLGSMAYYLPKISKYHEIKDQHAVFTSETVAMLHKLVWKLLALLCSLHSGFRKN